MNRIDTVIKSSHSIPAIIKHNFGNPWDHINIPKAERKGKTPEEIQELRRQRWLKFRSGMIL